MRADIHDGPEHMLQSETEYIDARPHQPASTKASCTARPDHTSASNASFWPCADHFRSTPISRQFPSRSACPKGAMCGRLRVGKSFLHVLQHWSVQPCVRPVDAVHMTAGHNALRGSGPGHKPAFDNALAQVGCPDRRID